MRRPRVLIAFALALIAAAVLFSACGGDDDDEGTTGAETTTTTAPSSGLSPPSAGGLQLPPGIAECLADQGFDIEPSELHSVPQAALQVCFSALHQGGAAP